MVYADTAQGHGGLIVIGLLVAAALGYRVFARIWWKVPCKRCNTDGRVGPWFTQGKRVCPKCDGAGWLARAGSGRARR